MHIQNHCRALYLAEPAFRPTDPGSLPSSGTCSLPPASGSTAMHKNQHAHTADPVRKAAPEQQAVRHGLDLRQNTGTGRRKSGNSLKNRIYVGWDRACNHKRKCADRTHNNPAQRYCDKSFSCIHRHALRLFPDNQKSCQADACCRNCGQCQPFTLVDTQTR